MTLDTDWKSAGRHRMERYLVGDAERNQTIQPGKRGVARSPMNDITFLKKKASEVNSVLPVTPTMSATLPDLTIIAPCHKWPFIR